MMTAARRPSTAPKAIASAVMSSRPSPGTVPPRNTTVTPSRVTSALTTAIARPNGTAHSSARDDLRGRRARRPRRPRVTASSVASSSGCSNDSAAAPSVRHQTRGDARAGGVERARAPLVDRGDHGATPCRPVMARSPGGRQRRVGAALDREREVLRQALLGQRGGGRGHADLVGPGHDPGRRLRLDARRRHEAGPGAQRARRAAVGVEHHDRVAGAGRLGEHAGGARPALEPARDRVLAHVRPAADDHAQHLLARRLLEHRARDGLHAGLLEPRRHLVARALDVARADEPDREALALQAGRERLRERADHRGDPLRRLPRVVVPPDALAGAEPALGRPHRHLDAVDVVEPVGAPAVHATALHAVDLLHEAAAVAGVDVVGRLEHAHRRVALGGDLLVDALVQALAAEVARHGERDLAGRLALAEAAAGHGEAEQERQPSHPTVTSTREGWHEPVARGLQPLLARLGRHGEDGRAGGVRDRRRRAEPHGRARDRDPPAVVVVAAHGRR